MYCKNVILYFVSGAKCAKVIQSCECERSCYRASHNEAFEVQHNNVSVTKVRVETFLGLVEPPLMVITALLRTLADD